MVRLMNRWKHTHGLQWDKTFNYVRLQVNTKQQVEEEEEEKEIRE